MQRIVLLLCVLSACGHESVQTSDTAVDTDSGEKHNNDSDTPTVDTDSTETTCATPIQEEYPFLMLLPGFQERTEISPGSETTIRVGLLQCCVFFEPIPTCAVYSIQPENQSATIDPENGLLVVDEDVPDSTRFTLTADIEDGQFVVEQPVFVYQKALHPLRGFWFNKSSKTRPCLVSPVVYGDVLQLIFSASGQYFVSVNPLEAQIDYVGEYQIDLETQKLTMLNETGTHVHAEGSFYFEGDDLVLMGFNFALSIPRQVEPECGIVLEKAD